MKTEVLNMYKIVRFFLAGMAKEFTCILENGRYVNTKFSTFEDPMRETIIHKEKIDEVKENECWKLTKIERKNTILAVLKIFLPSEERACLFFEYKSDGSLEVRYRTKSGTETNPWDGDYLIHTFEQEEKIMEVLHAFEDAFAIKGDEESKNINRASIEKFFEKVVEIRGLREQSQN